MSEVPLYGQVVSGAAPGTVISAEQERVHAEGERVLD